MGISVFENTLESSVRVFTGAGQRGKGIMQRDTYFYKAWVMLTGPGKGFMIVVVLALKTLLKSYPERIKWHKIKNVFGCF